MIHHRSKAKSNIVRLEQEYEEHEVCRNHATKAIINSIYEENIPAISVFFQCFFSNVSFIIVAKHLFVSF